MPVALEQHLERIGYVKQTKPSRGVPCVHTHELASALFKQRARWHILRPAGGVIADFLGRVLQRPRTQSEEIGRDNGVVEPWHRPGNQSLGDDPAQQFLASIEVVPEGLERLARKVNHGD